MKLPQLGYFPAVADTLNFSRKAEQPHAVTLKIGTISLH
jgi:hypothetical protein